MEKKDGWKKGQREPDTSEDFQYSFHDKTLGVSGGITGEGKEQQSAGDPAGKREVPRGDPLHLDEVEGHAHGDEP